MNDSTEKMHICKLCGHIETLSEHEAPICPKCERATMMEFFEIGKVFKLGSKYVETSQGVLRRLPLN